MAEKPPVKKLTGADFLPGGSANPAPAAAGDRPKHPVTGKALYGHANGEGKTTDEIDAMDPKERRAWRKAHVTPMPGEAKRLDSALQMHRVSKVAREERHAEIGGNKINVGGRSVFESVAPVMSSTNDLVVQYRDPGDKLPTYRTFPPPMNPNGTPNESFDHMGFLESMGRKELHVHTIFHPGQQGYPADADGTKPRVVSVHVGDERGGYGRADWGRSHVLVTKSPTTHQATVTTHAPYVAPRRDAIRIGQAITKAESRNELPGQNKLTVEPEEGELNSGTQQLIDMLHAGLSEPEQEPGEHQGLMRQGLATYRSVHEDSLKHPRFNPFGNVPATSTERPTGGGPHVTNTVEERAGFTSLPRGRVMPDQDVEALGRITEQYGENLDVEARRVRTHASRLGGMAAHTTDLFRPSVRGVGEGTGYSETSTEQHIADYAQSLGGGFSAVTLGGGTRRGFSQRTPKTAQAVVHITDPGAGDPERSIDPEVVGAHRVGLWAKAMMTGDDADLEKVHTVEGRLGTDGSPDAKALSSHKDLEFYYDPGQMVAARHLIKKSKAGRSVRGILDRLAVRRLGEATVQGHTAATGHDVHQDIAKDLVRGTGDSTDRPNFLYSLAERHGVDPNEGHAHKILENAQAAVSHRTRFDIGYGQIGVPPEVSTRSEMLRTFDDRTPDVPTTASKALRPVIDPDTGEQVPRPSKMQVQEALNEVEANKFESAKLRKKVPLSGETQAVLAHAAVPTYSLDEHAAYHSVVRAHRKGLVHALLNSPAGDSLFPGGQAQRTQVAATSTAINAARERSERGAAATGTDLESIGGIPR